MSFSDQIHPKTIRQLLLLIVIFTLGVLLYREMHFMLGAFMGALALYMLMRMPMFYLVYQKKWPRSLVALLLMLLSLLVIVLPLAWVVNVLIDELTPMLQDTSKLEASMHSIDRYLHKKYGIDLLSDDVMQKIPSAVTSIGGSFN